ncbi:MAG: STAS domain-containing protein [Lachnospiraceae bacterium]|nr:STAS domain-containing protein [Lachnospiraceae bacterium]
MDIKISENGKQAVLFLKGHLDTYTAKEADAVFRKVSESHDEVTLDMSGVNYLSSAGIRVLRNLYMAIYKRVASSA